ncbi:hypothetical protein KCU93_g5279, partial [Aureobasidium melanogenum]
MPPRKDGWRSAIAPKQGKHAGEAIARRVVACLALLHGSSDLQLRKNPRSANDSLTDQAQADKITMPTNKKTDAAAAAPTTTKGSAPMSIPAGSIASIWLAAKAKITKDPTAGNIIKKANGQKLFIFEDEMLQHLMLLNA